MFLVSTKEEKPFEELGHRPIFVEKMQDIDVCQGGEAVFTVRANESPKIEWYKDDSKIENKGKFKTRDATDGGNKWFVRYNDHSE